MRNNPYEIVDKKIEKLSFGSIQKEGTYQCVNCGQKIYLDKSRKLPKCPKCGFDMFTKE